jgi:hypothetical protein
MSPHRFPLQSRVLKPFTHFCQAVRTWGVSSIPAETLVGQTLLRPIMGSRLGALTVDFWAISD